MSAGQHEHGRFGIPTRTPFHERSGQVCLLSFCLPLSDISIYQRLVKRSFGCKIDADRFRLNLVVGYLVDWLGDRPYEHALRSRLARVWRGRSLSGSYQGMSDWTLVGSADSLRESPIPRRH